MYSTKVCPRNEIEWNKRSSALNCNETNGYTCLPNELLTELLEFCYTQPFIWIEEGKIKSINETDLIDLFLVVNGIKVVIVKTGPGGNSTFLI